MVHVVIQMYISKPKEIRGFSLQNDSFVNMQNYANLIDQFKLICLVD